MPSPSWMRSMPRSAPRGSRASPGEDERSSTHGSFAAVRATLLVAGLATSLSFETAAFGGRTRFGWLHDTETVQQRTVELENWFVEQDGEKYAGGTRDENLIWWGPVIGITDRLELALPLEIEVAGHGMTSATNI